MDRHDHRHDALAAEQFLGNYLDETELAQVPKSKGGTAKFVINKLKSKHRQKLSSERQSISRALLELDSKVLQGLRSKDYFDWDSLAHEIDLANAIIENEIANERPLDQVIQEDWTHLNDQIKQLSSIENENQVNKEFHEMQQIILEQQAESHKLDSQVQYVENKEQLEEQKQNQDDHLKIMAYQALKSLRNKSISESSQQEQQSKPVVNKSNNESGSKQELQSKLEDKQQQNRALSEKEQAALELLRQGASYEVVQKVLGDQSDLKELTKQFFDKQQANEFDQSELFKMGVDLVQRSQSVKRNDEFFEKLLEQAQCDPNKDFIDPITFCIMVDPVVLSSGQVMDRKTVLDENGSLKFNQCPMTRQQLESKVYPVSFLKSHLREWLINRFNKLLQMAEQYRDQPDKFDRICELLELAMENLGEDIYKNEASNFVKLLLSQNQHMDSPQETQKLYIRACKLMHKEELAKFFNNEIEKIKDKAQSHLNSDEFEQSRSWLQVCDAINEANLGQIVIVDVTWLTFYKKKLEEVKQQLIENESRALKLFFGQKLKEEEADVQNQIKSYRIKIYKRLKREGVQEFIDQFIQMEKISYEDLIDYAPIKLTGNSWDIFSSTGDLQQLHKGTELEWQAKRIQVQADWSDQGYGVKKARLYLRLVRNNEVIHQEDIFGVCEREDPDQISKTYTQNDEIVSKSQAGDIYAIYGISGQSVGHEHKLYVYSMEVFISSKEDFDALEPKVFYQGQQIIDLNELQNLQEQIDLGYSQADEEYDQQVIYSDDDDELSEDNDFGNLFGDYDDEY